MRVISYLCGGLGNQMFQFAAGRMVALCHSVPLLLDLSWFASMEGCTPRHFQLEIFPALQRERGLWQEATRNDVADMTTASLGMRIVSRLLRKPHCRRRNCVFEQPGVLAAENALVPPVYLQGYWQHEHYFAKGAAKIRQDFSFPALLPQAASLVAGIEAESAATAVHIRRGDYATDSKTQAVHGLCSAEYYASALQLIKVHAPDACLFLFSDDPAWVREHFDTHGLPSIVVDLHSEDVAHHDMHLMSLCKHHIIANSSFSWWGAWLAQSGGMTIAPRQWFADPAMAERDPCPAGWLRV